MPSTPACQLTSYLTRLKLVDCYCLLFLLCVILVNHSLIVFLSYFYYNCKKKKDLIITSNIKRNNTVYRARPGLRARSSRGTMVAMLAVAITASRWHVEPCSLVQSVFVFSVNALTGAQNCVFHCGKPQVGA